MLVSTVQQRSEGKAKVSRVQVWSRYNSWVSVQPWPYIHTHPAYFYTLLPGEYVLYPYAVSYVALYNVHQEINDIWCILMCYTFFFFCKCSVLYWKRWVKKNWNNFFISFFFWLWNINFFCFLCQELNWKNLSFFSPFIMKKYWWANLILTRCRMIYFIYFFYCIAQIECVRRWCTRITKLNTVWYNGVLIWQIFFPISSY